VKADKVLKFEEQHYCQKWQFWLSVDWNGQILI